MQVDGGFNKAILSSLVVGSLSDSGIISDTGLFSNKFQRRDLCRKNKRYTAYFISKANTLPDKPLHGAKWYDNAIIKCPRCWKLEMLYTLSKHRVISRQ